MAHEIGLLSVFDSGRLKEPPSIWTSFLKWLLLVPRYIALVLLWITFLVAGIVSYLAVQFAAKFPQDNFDLKARFANWTWRVGFYSLEEFIYRNWANIDWGASLELYKTNKQDGRRFSAGSWIIDFLAYDLDSNDLVVIQLTRAETSDSTVGQLLRYISWVKEKVAENNQDVKGIIITRKDDAALEYAVRNLPFVEIKTYEVVFQMKLKPVVRASTPTAAAEQKVAVAK